MTVYVYICQSYRRTGHLTPVYYNLYDIFSLHLFRLVQFIMYITLYYSFKNDDEISLSVNIACLNSMQTDGLSVDQLLNSLTVL